MSRKHSGVAKNRKLKNQTQICSQQHFIQIDVYFIRGFKYLKIEEIYQNENLLVHYFYRKIFLFL